MTLSSGNNGGTPGSLMNCWQESKVLQRFESNLAVSSKGKHNPPSDLAIPPVGMCSREMDTYIHKTCMVFLYQCFLEDKALNVHHLGQWIIKWFMSTHWNNKQQQKEWILVYVMTGMHLKSIIHGERKQSKSLPAGRFWVLERQIFVDREHIAGGRGWHGLGVYNKGAQGTFWSGENVLYPEHAPHMQLYTFVKD
jgi:hypothetical protein